MIFYEYEFNTYAASPQGKQKMREEMATLGDQGYRIHTFTPINVEGSLVRYEVLYELERERE